MGTRTQFSLDLDIPPPPPLREGDVVAVPLWNQERRGFPIGIALSSVFTTSSKERKFFKDRVSVASQENFEVFFAGTELRIDSDQEVWMQLLHLARGQAGSVLDPLVVRFSANDFLRQLGWSNSKEYYGLLEACLDRLKSAEVRVVAKNANGRQSGKAAMSFISNYKILPTSPKGTSRPGQSSRARWEVVLDRYAAAGLFETGTVEFDAGQRQRLNRSISKWLLEKILVVQENVFSASVDDLMALSGSGSNSKTSFKQNLKRALEDLVGEGVVKHYTFEGDILYATKVAGAQVNRGAPPVLQLNAARGQIDQYTMN